MEQSRKALFQSPHVSASEATTATTSTMNASTVSNTIELENATQFYRSETEKELHSQHLQKIRENIQSLAADAWLYQDPDKLIGFQRIGKKMNLCKLNDVFPLVHDKYSCLEYKTQKLVVPLPPKQIGRAKGGIKRILEENSSEIAKKLNGFLLSIGKINLLSDVGQTFQDEATLWVPIKFSFILFMPERGRRVRATVSKLGNKHIACLIHSRFNASFHRDTIPPVYQNFTFKLGQSVLLEIIECDVVDKILDIKTTLVEVQRK